MHTQVPGTHGTSSHKNAGKCIQHILRQTQQWKEQQTKGTSTQPLRVVLGQMVIQEILDRFTKLQIKGTQDPIWQKAIQQLIITPKAFVAPPAMGSDSEEASSVAQQDPYQGGTDSESLGGFCGVHAEPGPSAQVQEPPTTTGIQ